MRELQNAIGYHFQNPDLLQQALTHTSYANEVCQNGLYSYERLEFLGDSILGFTAADYLLSAFPQLHEGDLSKLRADLVIADVVESVIAAIYLDGGLAAAQRFIYAFVLVDTRQRIRLNTDWKTKLQELIQRKKDQSLVYELTGETGPDHDKTFSVRVLLNGSEVGQGTGTSKKRAEQAAAREAVERLFPQEA